MYYTNENPATFFFPFLTICQSFHVNNTKFWLGKSESLKVESLAVEIVTTLVLGFNSNYSLLVENSLIAAWEGFSINSIAGTS